VSKLIFGIVFGFPVLFEIMFEPWPLSFALRVGGDLIGQKRYIKLCFSCLVCLLISNQPLLSARPAPRNLVIIVVRGNRHNHVPDVDNALAIFGKRYNSAFNILFKVLDEMELEGPNSGALPWGPTPWSVSSLKICSL
jgi:hypothetical protein